MNLSGTKASTPEFQATLDFFDGLINSGIKLGLESTRNFLACLGNPHADGRFIHIAGTNGKGSVGVYLANALTACGLRTGFFSSPHLVNLRERLRIDGEPIPETVFATLASEMRERGAAVFAADQAPTFFEFMTVLGFLYFARERCDVVVMETGMGGRLDSTNVLQPELSIITSIGLDHLIPLGGTLSAIAAEKAGIIKAGAPVISDQQDPLVMEVLAQAAEAKKVPFIAGGRDFEGLDLSFHAADGKQTNHIRWQDQDFALTTRMLGRHQLSNVSVAWAALQTLASPLQLDLDTAAVGLAHARWPARLDQLPDGILLDAAHNAHAMAVLVRELDRMFPEKRWDLLFGCLKTKPWQQMLELLAPLCRSITVVGFEHRRLQNPDDTIAWLKQEFPGLPVYKADSPQTGLQRLRQQGHGLILGSLYLAGEILQEYYQGKPVPIIWPDD